MTTSASAEMLPAAERHRAADMISRSAGYGELDGEEFRGCSIGCFSFEINPARQDFLAHADVSQHYGYPEWLARLQDVVFEGLPITDAADWHVQIAREIDAINARHDNPPWQSILHLVHRAILARALPSAGSASDAVKDVMHLHEAAGRGEAVENAAWNAAWNAAESAAESAARNAARNAAWSAAESAARNAAESAAWSAAESAAYQGIRDDVLTILRAA